jgi:flagellin-like hook-associated protein FlgL
MRISDSTYFANIIFNLQKGLVHQAELQQQIASGKRIASPSDDPIGFGQAANYEVTLATLEQRERSVSVATGQLDEVDSALKSATDGVLGRAKELAISMANGVFGAAERTAAAEELKGLIGQMLEIANRKVGDRALFTGSTTRGRIVGTSIASPSISAPVTITAASNDTVAVRVDGVSSGTITLNAGTYTTGDALASQLQTKINVDPTLAAAGKSVKVSYKSDHLVVASNDYGSSSSVTVTGGSARKILGLAGGTTSTGADPFSLAVRTSASDRNTGGAVITPGEVANSGAVTLNDYVIKFTSASNYNLYNANGPVFTTPATANSGGGTVTKSAVNDPSQLTLDSYELRFKNIYTVTAGVNDGLRFDPGTGAVTATLAAGAYTGAQLASQIKSAMEASSGGKTYTVGFNEATGKYSITNDSGNGTVLSLLFSHAASTAKSLLGSGGTDQTGIAVGGASTSDLDTTGAAGVTKQFNVFDSTTATNIFQITTSNNKLIVNDTAGGAGADTIISLTPGSYTGAQLANELGSKLNASRNAANAISYTVAYGSTISRRFTINNPAGNTNALILKFADAASTAGGILGSTPITVTETVGASATTLNSDSANGSYTSDGSIDFDGLRVAINDGVSAVRNGDVFSVNQSPALIASRQYTSGGSVEFDGLRFSIDGTGAGAPAAGDIFRIVDGYQYNGDAADASIEVGDNLSTGTLLNGDAVFVGSNDVFAALQSLTRALLSNNVDGIQASHISLDAAMNQVLAAQGSVGARANRLSGIKDGLAQYKADIQILLSGIQDTDIAKTASELAFQQLALQAAAQAAGRIAQTSLLNYLR